MHMLSHRTQVLLDDDRLRRVKQRATETDRSVGAVIREAIDQALPARTMTPDEAFEYFRTAPRLGGDGSPEAIKRDILSASERFDE